MRTIGEAVQTPAQRASDVRVAAIMIANAAARPGGVAQLRRNLAFAATDPAQRIREKWLHGEILRQLDAQES